MRFRRAASRIAIDAPLTRTMAVRCHSRKHLLTLSRAAPTMFPNSRCDTLMVATADPAGRGFCDSELRNRTRANRTGNSCMATSAMCRSVARSRSHSTLTSLGQASGRRFQEFHDRVALEHRQIASGHGARVGSSFPSVQQGHLAEHLAGLEDCKHDFSAIRRGNADAHRAGQHCHHAGSGRAHQKNSLAGSEIPHSCTPDDRIPLVSHQAAEEHAIGEQSACIIQRIFRLRIHCKPPRLPARSGQPDPRREHTDVD
jgi:hypothetical protein